MLCVAQAHEEGERQEKLVRTLKAKCAQAEALMGRCLRQGDAIADLQVQLRAAEVQRLLLHINRLHLCCASCCLEDE